MRTPPERRRDAGLIGSEGFSSIPPPRSLSNLTSASDQLNRMNVDALWRAHQRAVELDLAERTPETRIIRTLIHRAWRGEYLADEVAL